MPKGKPLDKSKEQSLVDSEDMGETVGDQSSDPGQLVFSDEPAATTDEDKALDFSNESTSDESDKSIQLGEEYDPRPQEDTARRVIAYLLIWLLWVVIAGILILLAFQTIKLSDIKEFAVILGPLVTLVSAATGFYYGTKNNNK